MATVNVPLAIMDSGLFTLSFDYDDVSLLLLAVHIVNANTRAYTINAWSTSTGKRYTFTSQPGTNLDQNVTPGAQNRLQLSVTPSGKLDGVGWEIF